MKEQGRDAQRKKLAANLRKLRGNKSQSEVAEAIGAKQVTYSTWECATYEPSLVNLQKLCEYHNVTLDQLTGAKPLKTSVADRPQLPQGEDRPPLFPGGHELISMTAKIPVIGQAAAAGFDPHLTGFDELFAEADEYVPYFGDNPKDVFALKIAGDSMEPVLTHGDVVMVRYGEPPKTGYVCVANHRSDGVICKRWSQRNDVIRLDSMNPPKGKNYKWTKAEYLAEQPIVWCFMVESMLRKSFFNPVPDSGE